jgi:hypothetical protein
MQTKEWTRAFGWCNPVEHAVTKQHSKHECSGEEPSQEQRGPQAGRPRPAGLPPSKAPSTRLPQVSHFPSSLFMCLIS